MAFGTNKHILIQLLVLKTSMSTLLASRLESRMTASQHSRKHQSRKLHKRSIQHRHELVDGSSRGEIVGEPDQRSIYHPGFSTPVKQPPTIQVSSIFPTIVPNHSSSKQLDADYSRKDSSAGDVSIGIFHQNMRSFKENSKSSQDGKPKTPSTPSRPESPNATNKNPTSSPIKKSNSKPGEVDYPQKTITNLTESPISYTDTLVPSSSPTDDTKSSPPSLIPSLLNETKTNDPIDYNDTFRLPSDETDTNLSVELMMPSRYPSTVPIPSRENSTDDLFMAPSFSPSRVIFTNENQKSWRYFAYIDFFLLGFTSILDNAGMDMFEYAALKFITESIDSASSPLDNVINVTEVNIIDQFLVYSRSKSFRFLQESNSSNGLVVTFEADTFIKEGTTQEQADESFRMLFNSGRESFQASLDLPSYTSFEDIPDSNNVSLEARGVLSDVMIILSACIGFVVVFILGGFCYYKKRIKGKSDEEVHPVQKNAETKSGSSFIRDPEKYPIQYKRDLEEHPQPSWEVLSVHSSDVVVNLSRDDSATDSHCPSIGRQIPMGVTFESDQSFDHSGVNILADRPSTTDDDSDTLYEWDPKESLGSPSPSLTADDLREFDKTVFLAEF